MFAGSPVTIVIPVYNREMYVRDAVESVLGQTWTNWRLLVVDDASDDGTFKIVSAYLHDPRIEVIRQPVNLGVSHALNRALDVVETPYFLQLDSDDWLETDALHCLLERGARESDQVALIYGHRRTWTGNNGHLRPMEEMRGPLIRSPDAATRVQIAYPRFYRTAALKTVGGWSTADPYAGRYMEDRRIMIKLLEAGFKLSRIDRVLYNLRNHIGRQSKAGQPYREIKLWFYPQLIERWGADKYRLHVGRKIAIVPRKENTFANRRGGWKRQRSNARTLRSYFGTADHRRSKAGATSGRGRR